MIDIFVIIYRKLLRRIIDIREIKSIAQYILKKLGLYTFIRWKIVKFKRKRINPLEKIPSEFSQYINNGDLCFDVGAWEGQFIEILLRWGANVVAVEPQKECIGKLKYIYGKNKKVRILWNALGEKPKKGEISICDTSSQCSTLSERFIKESRFSESHKWTNKQEINIITLDFLIKNFGIPKFCKIDVEGYEDSVIRGLTTPIKIISFEFHSEIDGIVKNCCESLLKLGNVTFNCVFHKFPLKFHFSTGVDANTLYKAIEDQEDKKIAGDIYAFF